MVTEAQIIKDGERIAETAGAAAIATFVASSGELLSTTNWADLKVALISVVSAAVSAGIAAGVVAVRQLLQPQPVVTVPTVSEPPTTAP